MVFWHSDPVHVIVSVTVDGGVVAVEVTSSQFDPLQIVDTSCWHCESVQVSVAMEVVGCRTETVSTVGDIERDGNDANDDDDDDDDEN